jgi:hypothetical protein
LAFLPFFMVTSSMSLPSLFCRHLTQYIIRKITSFRLGQNNRYYLQTKYSIISRHKMRLEIIRLRIKSCLIVPKYALSPVNKALLDFGLDDLPDFLSLFVCLLTEGSVFVPECEKSVLRLRPFHETVKECLAFCFCFRVLLLAIS